MHKILFAISSVSSFKCICISLIRVHTVCSYVEISHWRKHLLATYDYSRSSSFFYVAGEGKMAHIKVSVSPTSLQSAYCEGKRPQCQIAPLVHVQ